MTRNNLILRKVIAKTLIVISGIVILCACFKISTYSTLADCILLSSIYLTLSFVLIMCTRSERIVIKVVSWVTMAVVFISGYFVGSVGILGIGLVSTEYEPQTILDINDHVIYRSYSRGNTTTSWRGTGITLSSRLKWLPFIEHRFFKKEYIGEKVGDLNDNRSSDHSGFSSYHMIVKYDKLKNIIILTDTSKADPHIDTLFLKMMK